MIRALDASTATAADASQVMNVKNAAARAITYGFPASQQSRALIADPVLQKNPSGDREQVAMCTRLSSNEVPRPLRNAPC
jgi:hypothetical protein